MGIDERTSALSVTVLDVEGYCASTYGDAFADAYDRWYTSVSDLDSTVAAILRCGGGAAHVLELGVGTGRIALALVQAGLSVVGVDSSAAMLERLNDNDPDQRVVSVHGAMEDLAELSRSGDPPFDELFDVVLIAYNTLFNLIEPDAQERCLAASRALLAPGGRLILEAFVPDRPAEAGSRVGVRSMTVDEVVLSVSEHDSRCQTIAGHFISFTESHGVRLRPWAVRYHTPDQLDAMAGRAGLQLEERWADFSGTRFDEDSQRHVSVYRSNA